MSSDDKRELKELEDRAKESQRFSNQLSQKRGATKVAISGRTNGIGWTKLVSRAELNLKSLKGVIVGG